MLSGTKKIAHLLWLMQKGNITWSNSVIWGSSVEFRSKTSGGCILEVLVAKNRGFSDSIAEKSEAFMELSQMRTILAISAIRLCGSNTVSFLAIL